MKKLIKKNIEIIRYLISGGLTFLISILSYYLCTFIFDIHYEINLHICNIISWIIAVSFAYWISRVYVFKEKSKKSIDERVKFVICRIITLLIELLLMYVLVFVIKIDDKIAKIISQIIVIILNYVFSKFFVFTTKNNKKK